ncbi:MAG: hypothetical protein F6K04_27145 [Leptolyngbya sp. SIO4C5]|nr:hypothetical protein [Leptolyngbya sp. SIO4C5]
MFSMLVKFYFLFAAIALFPLLQAFFKDSSTPKEDWDTWLFIALASLLWPFTLPSILSKKFS